MANWYVSSVGWTAVTAWAATTAYSIGDIRRQLAAVTVGNERVFRCTTAGTSGGSEPAWTLTKAATTADNTAVWTEITGNSTYNTTGFQAPHATLWKAVTSGWPAAGDTVFVDDDHTESGAAATNITFTPTASTTNPIKIICIASTHSDQPVAADLSTMGANAITATTTGTIIFNGSFYCYGCNFTSGSGSNVSTMLIGNASGGIQTFDTCTLKLGGTSASIAAFRVEGSPSGGVQNVANLINTNLNFSAAAQTIIVRGAIAFNWRGGAVQGTKPTALFGGSGINSFVSSTPSVIADVDLSLITTSAHLVSASNIIGENWYKFNNCLVATNLAGVMTGTIAAPNLVNVDFVVSDSTANVLVREEHYQYSGSLVQNTTNVRTGGASNGTTATAWTVVTLAGAKAVYPFWCPDIYQWIDSTGSKTISVNIANNSSIIADNLDIGFEVEYLGSSASPIGTMASTAPGALGLLSTTTDWTDVAGTEFWGGSTTNEQVMSKTVTINAKGWVRVRPYVLRAGFTVYIDPLIVVT